MTDGPSRGGEVEGDTGPKPSIAEVAAWLRRAAESRDGIEELRPGIRRPAAPEPADEPHAVGGPAVEERSGHGEPVPVQEPAAPPPADDEARPEPSVGDAPPSGSGGEAAGVGGSPAGKVPADERPAEAPAAEADVPPKAPEPWHRQAPAAVADDEPDDGDTPVVSPALALFASAVVRHNTSGGAAVRPTQVEQPEVEPLVQDELPMAAGDDVEAPAPVGTAEPTPEPGPEDPRPPRRSAASLFDLDLAELAARARARSDEPVAPREPFAPGPSGVPEVDRPLPEVATTGFGADLGGSGRSQLFDTPPVEASDEPVGTSGLGLSWDLEAPVEGEREADAAQGEATAEHEPEPEAPKESVLAAAMARRRAHRQRYPRGQLKERIGFLRRLRAMLGVLVLTVVLGVAAGAAIGAFLVFLAFAVRSAITSS